MQTNSLPPEFSIYNPDWIPRLSGMLEFECKSLAGRAFLNHPPPDIGSGAALLNLGCGKKHYPGFVNADFFVFRGGRRLPGFWGLDLRYPLNCKDAYWDGVFSEHTLEHLHPTQVCSLLKEVRRTLKPGGWLRLVVPDLAKYVEYYIGKNSSTMFSRWQPRAAALRSVSQNYLHQSLWDAELMTDCLRRAGFSEIRTAAFQLGSDPRLLKDTPDRAYESLYMEAQK